MPHKSTKEKPSFLLFGVDLWSPTEAALLPTTPVEPCCVEDYRQEAVLSLSSVRELAADAIWEAQKKYKRLYDRKSSVVDFRVGYWVIVLGKNRKLSPLAWALPGHLTSGCTLLRMALSRSTKPGSLPVHYNYQLGFSGMESGGTALHAPLVGC